MVYQSFLLFHLPVNQLLAGFVLCGSVCSYNFHWYLTPPAMATLSLKLKWNVSNKAVHLLLFVAGLAGAGYFAFRLIAFWPWLLITVCITFLYSAPKIPNPAVNILKKVAVGKTIYLALVWAHITALLPLALSVENMQSQHWLFFINRFFLIYAICIMFDYRDVDEDRKAGIKSLITFLTNRSVDKLFWTTGIIFLISSLLLLKYFSMLTVICLTLPAVAVCLLYSDAKQSKSDYLYYFVLDGLMMLSFPLLLLAKFAG